MVLELGALSLENAFDPFLLDLDPTYFLTFDEVLVFSELILCRLRVPVAEDIHVEVLVLFGDGGPHQ